MKAALAIGCIAALNLMGQITPTISLVVDFEQVPPPSVVDSLNTELNALFHSTGARIDWHHRQQQNSLGITDAAIQIHFKGTCRQAAPDLVTGALAWTHRTEKELLPLIDVNCSSIAAYVAAGLKAPLRSNAVLGRALARVVAHELYHYLTGTVEHRHSTLFSSGIQSHELSSVRVAFEASELTVLKTALDRLSSRRVLSGAI